MKSVSHRDIFFRNIAQTSPAPLGLEIDRAKGIDLYDRSGKVYKDLISGISVSNLGHGHPEVVEAVKQQAEKHMHLMVYGEYIQSPQTELAELMASLLPSPLDNFYFVNSGTEAVEGAMKLAKNYTGHYEVVAFKNAYHGSTQGSLSLMGNETLKQPFRPLVPGVRHIEFNNEEQLELITEKTACVIIEPVQSEAGVIVAEKSFIKRLRERCTETGALLVFDEIQTGMGRTGKLFCFEHYGVVPDVLLTSKAFGGGMPLGAFISSKEIMGTLAGHPALGHLTTFGGHPVCCAAAITALKVLLREKYFGQVASKENLFRKLLSGQPSIKEIRSKGLLLAIDLGDAEMVQKVIRYCLEDGVVLDWFLFNSESIRIAPPLIITDEEIVNACLVIVEALKKL
jgi:acetylornithine/succinyldiaminopimelate/putrescine aminotransferase